MKNQESKEISTSFESKLYNIHDWTILRLPKTTSLKLPSRGPVMVEGTINDFKFKNILEPDSLGSHWIRVDDIASGKNNLKAGKTVNVTLHSSSNWIEPEISKDLKEALSKHPKANSLWKEITPNAHWDWVRWIRATKNPETRKRRIEVAMSKLKKGMRRPCCFNRSVCTEPYVSNNWVLLDPKQE